MAGFQKKSTVVVDFSSLRCSLTITTHWMDACFLFVVKASRKKPQWHRKTVRFGVSAFVLEQGSVHLARNENTVLGASPVTCQRHFLPSFLSSLPFLSCLPACLHACLLFLTLLHACIPSFREFLVNSCRWVCGSWRSLAKIQFEACS